MNKTEQSRRYIILLGILLMLQVIAAFCFCTRKTGFHYDEYYSYYSSNVSYGLVPTDREWKPGSEIQREFAVQPGEQFRFPTVVRMQSYDVHPPFYYLLLHAVCSLTPGLFTKWSGLALNLVLFAASWMLLARLAWRLGGQRWAVVLGTCLLYGFNPGVVSGVMLVRMYTLLGFFVLAVTLLHVDALETGRRGWRFYVPLMLIVYLGFLTHYYYAVYLFFLAAAMEVWLLFQTAEQKNWGQKWKDCFVYGFAVVGAMLLAVLSYPACLGHIFRGYRGTEAMGAFFDLSNTLGRFRFFAGLLNEYVFGSMLPFFLLVLVLLVLTDRTLAKQREKLADKGGTREEAETGNVRKMAWLRRFGTYAGQHRTILIPAVAVCGYFVVVTKTALLNAEEANRYPLPVYGLILLLAVTLLVLLTEKVFGHLADRRPAERKKEKPSVQAKAAGILTAAMLILLTAGELFGMAQGKVLFLYEEDAENIAFAQAHAQVPVVYFYNPNLMWMIWDDSLELMQYEEIYFVNVSDLSALADEKLAKADQILVYCARGDHTGEALKAVCAGMPEEMQMQKVRELLYCDLYEGKKK